MDNPTSQPVSCVNCQAITTNDGKTVWVCERCGMENAPPTPDAQDAQAAISQAAASAGAPIPEITPPPASPAGSTQTTYSTAVPPATDK